MSENCTHECGSCNLDCAERTTLQKESLNEFSRVKKVIGVVSGKGGVGKSMVTSLLAIAMNKRGSKTAILDADITGPSIARAFGVECLTYSTSAGIAPAVSSRGIDIMSINLILENPKDPVVWRGPVIGGVVKQFWTDVVWKDEEYMFIDMPPGTGDVPLTVFQSLPVDGIIVVTSPQELVSMIVEKAVRMADMMNIPIIGIVENLSYFECPDCGKKYNIFGESHIEEIADKYGIKNIARMPINPKLAQDTDKGNIEAFDSQSLSNLVEAIENMDTKWKEGATKLAVTYADGEVFQHFGHTKEFKIYDIVGGKIQNSTVVSVEGAGHSELADFLASIGVKKLICGGIGAGAKTALMKRGIAIYGGVNSNADTAAYTYLRGQLAYNPDVECTNHEEGHACHGHEDGHTCVGHGDGSACDCHK